MDIPGGIEGEVSRRSGIVERRAGFPGDVASLARIARTCGYSYIRGGSHGSKDVSHIHTRSPRAGLKQTTTEVVGVGDLLDVTGWRVRADGEVVGIQQPFTTGAVRSRYINPLRLRQQERTRRLNPSAIASGLATASQHGALSHRAPRRVRQITPNHHRAAIAVTPGRGIHQRAGLHPGLAGLAHGGVGVLPASTHLHQATIPGTGRQQFRSSTNPNQISGECERAAITLRIADR